MFCSINQTAVISAPKWKPLDHQYSSLVTVSTTEGLAVGRRFYWLTPKATETITFLEIGHIQKLTLCNSVMNGDANLWHSPGEPIRGRLHLTEC